MMMVLAAAWGSLAGSAMVAGFIISTAVDSGVAAVDSGGAAPSAKAGAITAAAIRAAVS